MSMIENDAKTRGKLVRDKIPDIIRKDGQDPIVRVASLSEMPDLLRRKLTEELAELAAAAPADVIDEAADVMEVLAALHGISFGEVLRRIHLKRIERGGFTERIVWEGNR